MVLFWNLLEIIRVFQYFCNCKENNSAFQLYRRTDPRILQRSSLQNCDRPGKVRQSTETKTEEQIEKQKKSNASGAN